MRTPLLILNLFTHLRLSACIYGFILLNPQVAHAHPLVKSFYDRTAAVHLSADSVGRVVVRVEYRLELNVNTAVWDLRPFVKELEPADLDTDPRRYAAFALRYAPVLADKMYLFVDNKNVELTCTERKHDVEKQKQDGAPSETLVCHYVFQGSVQPQPGDSHTFSFEEGAYLGQPGILRVSVTASPPITHLGRVEVTPGDDELPRNAATTFTLPTLASTPENEERPPAAAAKEPRSAEAGSSSRSNSLLDLLFDTRRGFALLLVLAVVLGAFHALTPGHGKTLVAAYLVGERGTLGHAFVLGLVTTLTHTGAVLAIAAALWFFPQTQVGDLQVLLGVGGGLLVAGMGFWLLYRRLAGQADHFHIGGGHHHHHGDHDHGHADHYHDEHGHAHPIAAAPGRVGWWNLLVLGVSGGIVPCTDAIVMLILAVGKGYLDRALPLLLAFSAGLAAVLIAIGMLVVTSKRFAGSHLGESRLFRALPIVSAALVMCLGLWLCYDAMHAGGGGQ
jgi:ABC-type nickel/cobalt efflux system permease component RcnA